MTKQKKRQVYREVIYRFEKDGILSITHKTGTKSSRKITRIERWAMDNGHSIEQIAFSMDVDHGEYNRLMRDPQELSVKQLKCLVKLTDKTIKDLLYSTFLDTDMKELSESEIRYVAAIRRFRG